MFTILVEDGSSFQKAQWVEKDIVTYSFVRIKKQNLYKKEQGIVLHISAGLISKDRDSKPELLRFSYLKGESMN